MANNDFQNGFLLGASIKGKSQTSIPPEALNLTGDQSDRFLNGRWDWFITNYGSQVTTSNIYGSCIFKSSKVTEIPIILNMTGTSDASKEMFYNCVYLTSCPTITGVLKIGDSLFSNCDRMRDINGLLGVSNYNSVSYCRYMFKNCSSLRAIPVDVFNRMQSGNINSSVYKDLFSGCFVLDEISNLFVIGTSSSNLFNQFWCCSRLKEMKFITDSGTPKTANWTNQTIDLSFYVGYSHYQADMLNHNSGIALSKKVTDASSYNSLKNDPDWFTMDVAYSRYNHDSAVNTINTLPDTSAYVAQQGGTNTIKFKGASGSATDGGAINTLTAEEIAVAATKGWTVTLV